MIRPHAFVAMPFGSKPGADGNLIDFNQVYAKLIAPALEAAGLESFRADEEIRLGRREIYVHYGNGMGRSRLKIPAAKAGTARNINTISKLAEMAAGL